MMYSLLRIDRAACVPKFNSREPVSQWNDKSYSETKKVLEKILDGNYKMSKKLRGELELLYVDYYS